jgi:uncharacterized membrane protein
MNKMLIAVFDSESQADEGAAALHALDADGSIVLYAWGMIAKDASGAVTVKQTAARGPLGSAVGLVIGSLIGLFGGPVGVVAGIGLGTAGGVLYDAAKFDVDDTFLHDVGQSLRPGKVAVVADVEEIGVALVDAKLGNLGALVFRRPRSEVVEDQLIRKSVALQAELNQHEEELRQVSAETRAAVQQRIDTVRQKLEAKRAEIETHLEQSKREADARIAALRERQRRASDQRKAEIEQRIAETEADYAARNAKLEVARKDIVDTFIFGGPRP